MSDIRVRFAPSPSGFLHIGGARTALFNYLFAKKRGGKFIVRIDDTDALKSSDDSIKSILSDLKWLGLNWDHGLDVDTLLDLDNDGPYRASKRKDIYLDYAQKLIDLGKAYKVTDDTGAVIKFKVPKDVDIIFYDDIRGKMTMPKNTLDDFIIIRSNGMATYNFATVIDDHLMKITHVYRADEHLTNTYKHVLIFNAFDWDVPKFGHMALIFGADRTKLSKRHGATSLDDFRRKGYIKDALINYISMLGWGHPKNKDIYAIDDLINEFSIKRVNSSPAIFDIDKLKYINSHYIKNMRSLDIYNLVVDDIKDIDVDKNFSLNLIDIFKSSWHKLSDVKLTLLKFDRNLDFDDLTLSFLKNDNSLKIINLLKDYLKDRDTLSVDHLISYFKDLGFVGKDLMWTIRAILIGSTDGPAIKVLLPIYPRDLLIHRIDKLLSRLKIGA